MISIKCSYRTSEEKKPEYYVEFPPEEGEVTPERKQLNEFEKSYRSLIAANPKYAAFLSEVKDFIQKPLPQYDYDQSYQNQMFHPRQTQQTQQKANMNYNSQFEELDKNLRAIQNLMKRK